ncbi:SusC/RagA family TonB-linked outer membrane protein [Niabella beijingensis]|uniref:SusC/RagA family TonB-linked outer membrane protein n=1 Tax=Niabella beijingensis TaxID=2872700 RepID=UPI001CC1154D|nr:TonB-dependent receptor [Niabella beijingensis]MBZ4191944.1 TonB-dependent receptor [Niabella beijingensis]
MKVNYFLLKYFLFLLFIIPCGSIKTTAQNGPAEIKGQVKDAENTGLSATTVRVKGTDRVTASDDKGFYSITAASHEMLLFSHVGYLDKEVEAAQLQSSGGMVLLDPVDDKLDEVVVVGYGTVKKKDLTGAVIALSPKDFNKGAITSADQLIAGKAAGVQVVQNSGEPGGGISVNIRGVGSINGGNSPLYVVDGLPLDNSSAVSGSGTNFTGMKTPRNPLNSINPNDIASIEILKDASATAIYGSRGANGVVLITTKSGKSGALKVTYDVYAGIQNVAHKIELLNPVQYKDVINAIIDEGGGSSSQKVQEIAGNGTDWLEQAYHRNAGIQNHNLSLSGGNEKTSFMASLNYYDQDGILIRSNNKRYTARVNLEHRASEKFKMGINVSTGYVKDRYVPNGMDLNERAGIIYAAMNYDPTLSIYDEQGKYTLSKDMNIDNPLAIANGKTAVSDLYRTFGTMYGEYTILKGLSARLNIGGDVVNQRRDTYVGRLTIDGAAAGGIASILNGKNSNYLVEGTLNYKKDLKNSSINAVVGMTGQRFVENASTAEGRGFPSDAVGTDNLGLGNPAAAVNSSSKSENSLLSYLGRVNYVLHNKYLLTGTMRIDGSSRFGANNKFGYFPSVALGWKINEESFLSDVSEITNLKLRASWGRTGNQEIGNYQSMSTFGTGLKTVFDGVQVTSLTPSRIANPDLKWETAEQLNIGVDFGLFGNRLSGSLEWYSKTTRDMLLSLPVPRSTGFATMLSNAGSMRNTGVEIMLSGDILTGPFTWNANASFNTLKNRVLDLAGISNIISGSAGSTSQIAITEVGQPVNAFYGYIIDGVWQQNDDFSKTKDNVKPGDLRFRDINGDQVVNADDRVIIGKSFPDLMGSFTSNFGYKNFQLYVFLEGVKGVSMLNNNMVDTYFPANLKRNRLAEPLLNRWTESNPSNVYPSFVTPNAQGQKTVNSYTVEDASYLRLNTIRLSYAVPLKKGVIKGATVYLSAQNIWTLTDYTGYDPALNPYGGANFRIDWNAYPSSKTFLAGVTIDL